MQLRAILAIASIFWQINLPARLNTFLSLKQFSDALFFLVKRSGVDFIPTTLQCLMLQIPQAGFVIFLKHNTTLYQKLKLVLLLP